jgi:cbb3-type cytochrome oxidase subunit 3
VISFLRKHKISTALVSVVLLVALWYLFRPEKLFINKQVNEAAPFALDDADQPAYTGLFKTTIHETAGRASVYRNSNGSLSLKLTDFHTSNGPDVHVVLGKAGDPALTKTSPGTALELLEIAPIKGNEGDQVYTLPANVDFSQYNTVVIYCERFRAVFGSAGLQPF